ncbi:hypothetical protein N7456_001162 [Penicillium angulare]|uniref:Uncharacterized protein n=1 Tax=Penicillium angulare TaxID=116970 RepID=A0A9W9GDH4_9EURO|nr:hypothetical protein N7456_001162 [Penicillium angulare]
MAVKSLPPKSHMWINESSYIHITNQPLASPTSDFLKRVHACVAMLQIDDPRYNIKIYGQFMAEIPSRMGHNPALDDAANALANAFPYLHTRKFPSHVLYLHNQSLRSLRSCLDNPVQAQTSHTLCAIWLIVICQNWIGVHGQYPNHGRAMTQIMNAAVDRKWETTFEAGLITSISAYILYESITHPDIALDTRHFERASASLKCNGLGSGKIPAEMINLRHIARISTFMRYPDIHHDEIVLIYQRLYQAIDSMIPYVESTRSSIDFSRCSITYDELAPFLTAQAGCNMIISLALILNGLQQSFGDKDPSLSQQAVFLCDRIASSIESATCYRPLGSSYAPVCLIATWPVASDPITRRRIEALMMQYEQDLNGSRMMGCSLWIRSIFTGLNARMVDGASREIYDPAAFGMQKEACIIV